MALATNAKNIGLDAIVAVIGYLSLHSDVVGSGNTNELSGGSPAYARKAVTWGAAASGSVALSNQPVFDVPASATVARVGLQSAVTAGTYYGDADVTDETFGGQGTYTVTAGTISITG
jgi:hypothetical protein